VGSSWRHMVACMYCTSAEGIAAVAVAVDADADCTASSYSHPAACLALPADDDRSSCRLGRLSFQTDRVLDRIGDAFAAARCRMELQSTRTCCAAEDGQRIEDEISRMPAGDG
jgi:hypothetical protein